MRPDGSVRHVAERWTRGATTPPWCRGGIDHVSSTGASIVEDERDSAEEWAQRLIEEIRTHFDDSEVEEAAGRLDVDT